MDTAAKHKKIWLIAGIGCFLLLVTLFFLMVRLRSARYPYPDSDIFIAVFNWDGALRSLSVINYRTGKEERNQEIRLMVIAGAKKSLPKFVANMGLQRAAGKLSCGVVGTKENYTINCDEDMFERNPWDYDPDAKTPLMLAAKHGDASKIEELVHAGADINAKDQHGVTVLMRSVNLEQTKVLKFLIDAGAKLNTQDSKGETALRMAVDGENIDGVKMLIASGADPNMADVKGWTPLMEATTPEMARALIAGGADVNAADKDGETAVMIAAQFGSLDLLRVLLKARGNVHARSKSGRTALDLAREAGSTQAVALLQKTEQASSPRQ